MSNSTAALDMGTVSNAACLVLAAGLGNRMGGPKALLNWQGQPLALAHTQARQTDCSQTLIVTRPPIAAVLRRISPLASILLSDQPDSLGPAGSIAAAVRAQKLIAHPFVLLTPVDVPPASTLVVTTLIGSIGAADAARPCWHAQRGHPVLCRTHVLQRHYAYVARPLRDVLDGLGASCVDVEVTDPDVLLDFDTPAAYEARVGNAPRFWP